jgi:hypothetical protein
MAPLFDVSHGKLLLDDGIILSAGMTEAQIEAQGLVPQRDYPLRNGAAMRSFQPRAGANHLIYVTATTQADHLVRIHLSFVDLQGLTPKEQQLEYSRFLTAELGPSGVSTHNGLTLTYTYSWGSITATYDPRNDSSGIYLAWSLPDAPGT